MKREQLFWMSTFMFLILFLLQTVPVQAAFNESFCQDPQRGYELLGSDFYVLCEENFVDEQYEGYEKYLEQTGERPLPLQEATSYPDKEPLNLEPDSLLDYYTLLSLGINESEIVFDQEEFLQNTSSVQEPENTPTEQPTLPANQSLPNSQPDHTDVGSPSLSVGENKTPSNSLESYLLYVGIGIFILLIMYVAIHILLKKHERQQQVSVAYSYVVLLRRKRYTDDQIRHYFMEKGYEEEFINEVLKTQDSKP